MGFQIRQPRKKKVVRKDIVRFTPSKCPSSQKTEVMSEVVIELLDQNFVIGFKTTFLYVVI